MPDVFISDDNAPEKKPVPEAQLAHHHDLDSFKGTPASLSFLTSYRHLPLGLEIKGIDKGEHIILFIRRHIATNIGWFIAGILLLFAPLILLFPIGLLRAIEAVIPFNFILVLICFYYLLITGFIYVNFITWFYNVGIITSKQIIDIDFTDIMYREVAKARINEVIDVEFTHGGLFQGIFGFGNVYIQTEGVKPNFEFTHVPHPDKISNILLDLKGLHK